MKKHIIPFVLSALALSVFSCNKEDDSTNDPTGNDPVVTITSPEDMTSYSLGDTIHIHAEATADADFHGYQVQVINLSNSNEVVLNEEMHVHQAQVTIDTFWVNNVSMHSDMKLVVTLAVDHDGNTISKEVHFHCHPM